MPQYMGATLSNISQYIGVGIKWVPRGVRFYSAKMLGPTPLQ